MADSDLQNTSTSAATTIADARQRVAKERREERIRHLVLAGALISGAAFAAVFLVSFVAVVFTPRWGFDDEEAHVKRIPFESKRWRLGHTSEDAALRNRRPMWTSAQILVARGTSRAAVVEMLGPDESGYAARGRQLEYLLGESGTCTAGRLLFVVNFDSSDVVDSADAECRAKKSPMGR